MKFQQVTVYVIS